MWAAEYGWVVCRRIGKDGGIAGISLGSCCQRRRGAAQGAGADKIVRQRMPQEDRVHLCRSAHRQLMQPAVAQMGVDAFMDRADLIGRLAGHARHAGAPGKGCGTIALAWSVGIAAVLAVGRGHEYGDGAVLRLRRPFDVGRVGKAAVDEKLLGGPAEALFDLLEHRLDPAVIGARRIDRDAEDDAALRVGNELPVIGRPEAAIRHLHHPRLGVGGRGARLLLLLRLIAVGPLATLPLHLQFLVPLVRPRSPSSDSRSRLTSPSLTSTAADSLNSRFSKSLLSTRKSDSV